MNASEKQLQFFKNYIKEKLNTIKDDIGQIRYKLYVAMVEECNDYDELREMAELEMQIDMIAYTNGELANKLKELNTDFETIKNIDSTIEYKITEEKKNENNEIFEDLEDDDVMDAMAHMLMQRIANEPEEEKRREELLDFDFEEEPSVDDIDIDEIADDFGELDDIISEDEAELGMNIDYESLNAMNLEEYADIGEITEEDDEDDFDINEDDFDIDEDDFGDLDEDDFEDLDDDEFDIDESEFGDLDDEETEETEEDSDGYDEDMEYDLSDFGEETTSLDDDTDDDFDIDDSDFGDLGDDDDDFDINEDDFGDLGDDDDEFDIDDSEFGDLDDEYEEETTNSGFSSFDIDEVDFDELGDLSDGSEESDEFDFDDSEFGDFDDYEVDESEFGDLDDIEVDEDDFGDLDDIDDVNEDDFGDLDDEFDESGFEDLIGDEDIEDEFDIDINDFGDLGDDDDITDVSKAKLQKPTITDDSSEYMKKRRVRKDNVFENGTDKGKKTQEAFNTMLKIGGLTAGFGKKAAKTMDKGSRAAIKATEKNLDKISKSSMLKLPKDDDDEFIDF